VQNLADLDFALPAPRSRCRILVSGARAKLIRMGTLKKPPPAPAPPPPGIFLPETHTGNGTVKK